MLGGFSESFKRAYAGFVVVKDASLLLAPGARRMRGLLFESFGRPQEF